MRPETPARHLKAPGFFKPLTAGFAQALRLIRLLRPGKAWAVLATRVAKQRKLADYHHLAARVTLARAYDAALEGLTDRLVRPVAMNWAQHAYWMYTVVLSDAVAKPRDQVIAELDALGIETRPVFHPMHTLPPYQDARGGPFPKAEHAGARGLNLPTYGALRGSDIERIAGALAQVLA